MQPIQERIAALSSEQRALFEQQLFAYSSTRNSRSQIEHRDPQQPCSLSSAQQRLWFIHQFNPTSAVYNMPKVLRLQGQLNLPALQQALNQIVERHEVLRTVFPNGDNGLEQRVMPPQPVTIQQLDLQDHAVETREEVARDLARRAIYQPFDLVTDLMMRGWLIRFAEDDHLFVLVVHHIATDGWSNRVLEKEWGQFYTAACANQSLSLPPLPIQYADYSVWQRQQLTGERLASQLAYWQQQFSNLPPLLDLPLDKPRPLHPTEHGAHEIQILSPALTAALRAFCLRENITLYMTLLAAFQTLLHRYTGQDDIVIGTPIANRTPIETEKLIGFFVNTLALRGDLAGDPTVRELLDRVRQTALAAYDHSELPFEKLIEELPIQRSLNHHPLFQVMFALQNLPDSTLILPGLTVVPFKIDKGTAPFDLNMNITDSRGELKVALYYKTELFEHATISRMVGHFINLLTAMVAENPLGAQQRISMLPILADNEQRQLLLEWNTTQHAWPAGLCIHHLFELQCRRNPGHTAIVYQDRQLTYGEMNQRANQLAHHLRKQGVGPATLTSALVAICLPRSPEAAIAMLAVLKAGGAFICLDAAWPTERIETILQQTQAQRVITSSAVLATRPTLAPIVIDLDTDAPVIQQAATENLTVAIQPEDLAYIVYTSGSTGVPKGIMATQRGIVNYVLFIAQTFNHSSADRRLQVSAFGSEYFIADIMVYLSAGTTLIFKPDDYVLSIPELLRLLTEQKITIASLPSAYWHQWAMSLSEPFAPTSPYLRLVFTGMDVIKSEAFALWRANIGDSVRWVNEYGPAETTIGSTYYEADFAADTVPVRVPIGRPIANTAIYILDAAMKPVPIGVPGEIYIGGAGLARGYINQPELTKEKFIPNPFSDQPDARLYRTGDLARYLPAGDIDFLGRKDSQVKVRGFRIELQEIESKLNEHPTVQAAVVTTWADQGDKQLVAYIVPEAGATVQSQVLRQYLKQRLPSYMIPHLFMPIAALPMTVSGKLDRLALPKPDFNRAAVNASFVAPRSSPETDIAAIWCEILEIKTIGIHDNFFDWGGHSLLATRIVARISQLIGLEFPLRTLFEAPTIAEMASIITRLQAQQINPRTLAEILHDLETLPEEQAQILSEMYAA